MKIKFNSDEDLPLNKTIEILSMTIVVRAIFPLYLISEKKWYYE